MNCWSIKSFFLCRCIVEDNFAVPSGVGSRHELTYEPWKTLRAPLKSDGDCNYIEFSWRASQLSFPS